MSKTRFLLVSILGLFTVSMSAHAALFHDVPDGHEFQVPIESLAGSGVIKGNPNGQYHPDNRVNRAEMLTMLYRAMDKVFEPSGGSCFPDVEMGAWYEPVVCDGVARKYVSGYPDGMFRPADSVSKVEALKMIHTVFEFQLSGDPAPLNNVPTFMDVSKSAWYAGFLNNAYIIGILPISGQGGTYFRPELPLSRKEAAAYIHNAFYARNQLREKARIAAMPRPEVDPIATRRSSDVHTILNAVYQYAISNSGRLPAKLPIGSPREICASGGKSCAGLVDLSVLLPTYLPNIPSEGPAPRTGYSIHQDKLGRIIVTSLNNKGEPAISGTR